MPDNRTENVKELKIGGKDHNGNTIVDIISHGDEFLIYEIEHDDPACKLRIFYSGETTESEINIIKKISAVQSKYIEAKSLIHKASNFTSIKHRIAEILWSTILVNEFDGNNAFEKLINDVNKEYNERCLNRIRYIAASTILFIITSIYFALRYKNTNNYENNDLIMISISSGNTLAILLSVKNIKFHELGKVFYILIGFERVLVSYAASIIAIIMYNSGLIFPSMNSDNIYTACAISIVASFAERYIPSVISKID